MLNYLEYITENVKLSTLEIKATYNNISDFIDQYNIEAEIIPKMQSCYVITDLHGLQSFRQKYDIVAEWSGELNLSKNTYEFKITTFNHIDTRILENFFKKFQSYGIYNIRLENNALKLNSYDTREAVLEYLKTILNRVIKNKIHIK